MRNIKEFMIITNHYHCLEEIFKKEDTDYNLAENIRKYDKFG